MTPELKEHIAKMELVKHLLRVSLYASGLAENAASDEMKDKAYKIRNYADNKVSELDKTNIVLIK